MKKSNLNCGLNLGCGNDYKKGWINLDFNKEVTADIYCDFDKDGLPFRDNSITHVFAYHTIEHSKNLINLMEELWRVCENGAIIKFHVPHYTGTHALKYPFHHNYFGIDTFLTFLEKPNMCGERYSKARFILHEETLKLFSGKHSFTKFINCFNFLFNFNHLWKMMMEKLFLFGFEEIYYKLEVRKKDSKLVRTENVKTRM